MTLSEPRPGVGLRTSDPTPSSTSSSTSESTSDHRVSTLSAGDRLLLKALPRLRSDLRRAAPVDSLELLRALRLLRSLSPVDIAEAVRMLPGTDAAARAVAIADACSHRLGMIAADRTLLAAASLLVDLDDDPQRAAAMAGRLSAWPTALPRLIAQSQERIDGTGRPQGLTGPQLSTVSQSLALVAECSRRLRNSDPVAAGASLQTMTTEADRGRWCPALAGPIVAVSLDCLGLIVTPTTPRTVRIDAAHETEQVATPSTPADRPIEAAARSLGGLRASQSVRPTRGGRR